MRVLIINGSPRQKGNTSIALAEIAKQLVKSFGSATNPSVDASLATHAKTILVLACSMMMSATASLQR